MPNGHNFLFSGNKKVHAVFTTNAFSQPRTMQLKQLGQTARLKLLYTLSPFICTMFNGNKCSHSTISNL